jgi:phosphatidylethanolamine-binding protein (PEBP) family uncharacterized protein
VFVPALLRLSSPDFGDGEPIPEQSSKDGGNAIPNLEWNPPPEGSTELVILCDDPDTPVGTWVHWVAAGIDPQTRRIEGQLPGARSRAATTSTNPATAGRSRHRATVCTGTSAPSSRCGSRGLAAGCTAEELRHAVVGKELARGVLIGTFER